MPTLPISPRSLAVPESLPFEEVLVFPELASWGTSAGEIPRSNGGWYWLSILPAGFCNAFSGDCANTTWVDKPSETAKTKNMTEDFITIGATLFVKLVTGTAKGLV